MEIKKEDVIKYWKFLGHKKQTEIRAIRPRWFEGEKFPKSVFIFNEEQLVKEIEKINGEYNIYIGINERKENGKEDADVEFITNIGHDIDAHGKGVEGLNKAGQIAFKIKDICLQQGFKEPLILNSGHGFWVIHHLPPIKNTEENVKKIKEFGKRIKEKHEEQPIEIDTTVYNPSRIARVPGTINVSDKEDFALSLIMNNPNGEEDFNLRDEILAIKLEEYKPNPLATSNPSICSFMDYCLTHEIPKGERHKVISRNMAIYISDHPDRELLKQQYTKIQKGSEGELDNYLKGIDEKGKIAFPFSIGELVNFTKKYKIPFNWKSTPEYNQWIQLKKSEELLQKEIKFEEELKEEKGNQIKLQYLDLAHDKKWSEATELLVDYILSINKIYTTKEDVKSECWIYKEGVYVSQGKSQVREDLRKLLGKYYSDWIFGKVMEKLEPDTFIDSNKFFNVNYVNEIPIQNGILNVLTKELNPFDKMKIFFNKIPVTYNPEATCPAIEKHLKDVLKYDEDINVMYEIIGFLLYKDYFLEKMFMLIGDGRNGKGKCNPKGTKVLMSNGEWKNVEDVKVGDFVISPQLDGSCKFSKVTSTHSRYEPNIYEVREYARKNRLLYSCADNHLIPFYRKSTQELSSINGKRKRKSFRILDLKEAWELAKMSPKKSKLTCFTTTALEYEQEDSSINPYCLGAWLGDGHFSERITKEVMKNPRLDRGLHGIYKHRTIGITTSDKEIITEFEKSYPNIISNISIRENNKAKTYHFSSIGKFANELIKLELLAKGSGNKFIPKECLLSSINYRKELLAGLIDTDGFIDKNGAIYYTTKSIKLATDIKNLTFSLGGYADIRKIIKKSQTGFEGEYQELSIQFVNPLEIPLRTWKKERLKKPKYNPCMIGIKVIKRKEGDLIYGFELDSPSHWFVTDNWMITHNTIDLIRRFLGVENCASVHLSSLSGDNFNVSELFGKMANLAGDLSNTSLKDTGMLKQTTGRDLIGADRKYLTNIKFINYAKHIFACNELPKVYDMSKGFWSRWIVLEFPYEFINENEYNALEENKRVMFKINDPYHIDKISLPEELSGLLNKALEGLQRIRKNKVFSYSKGTDEIKKFWIRKSDSFVAFCFDNLEEANDEEMTKAELRKAYHKFCSEHKLRGCSDKAMSITLQEMFGVIESRKWINEKQMQENIWGGIKFKPYSKYGEKGRL